MHALPWGLSPLLLSLDDILIMEGDTDCATLNVTSCDTGLYEWWATRLASSLLVDVVSLLEEESTEVCYRIDNKKV